MTLLMVSVSSCGGGAEGADLTIYSARSEQLLGPLLERFEEETGMSVAIKYGGSGELVGTILEEGPKTPADLFFAQDAGALGAVANEGMFIGLPPELLTSVDSHYRAAGGQWVGISGRARSIVYNTDLVDPDELPRSIMDFTDERWKGRIGWPPTNASFQSFVTALRLVEGDAAARAWLEDIKANDARVYKNNSALVHAVGIGEIEVGFANHYYLYRFLDEEGPSFPAANYFPPDGDLGSLVNVAGAGILKTSGEQAKALQLIEYLLSEESQAYFAETTFEFPLVAGVPADSRLPALEPLRVPGLNLGDLKGVADTLDLMREVGMF
ncbi:MAG: iron ABC transporter substrate-binding protein [Dehalococcoidia bacterium]|nr:iron ABC transporter substrate-binding protein [Dehalococcoidia bacterium]